MDRFSDRGSIPLASTINRSSVSEFIRNAAIIPCISYGRSIQYGIG